MSDGHYTIPTRVYLSNRQRERLMLLLRDEQLDLADLLTELLASLLDHLPNPDPAAPPPDPAELEAQIASRRAELRRLQARARAGGERAPAWVLAYVVELEQELQRLEQLAHPPEG